MRVRVERIGGLWPWKASVWEGSHLHLELAFTRAGALRLLRREILHYRNRHDPQVEVVELDV